MEPEIIDLGSLDIGDGGGNKFGGVKSSNFGGGLELLMNDRFKSGGDKNSSTNIPQSSGIPPIRHKLSPCSLTAGAPNEFF